jgi:hypothetical protein
MNCSAGPIARTSRHCFLNLKTGSIEPRIDREKYQNAK